MNIRKFKLVLLLGAVAVLVSAPPAQAGGRGLLTPDGDLFVVEEVGGGRALRAVIHRADGGSEASLITRDDARDAFPSLALDPDTGRPVLVWSRSNGVDFDLVLSRHDGERWSRPLTLVSTSGNELRPRAFTAPGEGLHVVWTVIGDAGAFHYGLFRVDSAVPLVGPERVSLKGLAPGDTEGGGDDPGIQPPSPGNKPPPPSDGGDPGSSGDDACTSEEAFQICAESAMTPGAAPDRCGRFSVLIGGETGQCLLTRGPDGWKRGACAPAGIDLRTAMEGSRLTCER